MYNDYINPRGIAMKPGREHSSANLSTLVLAVLMDAPRHGYAIAREIERRSESALSPGEGALYPALRGLEGEGLIEGHWEQAKGSPARKIYALTPEGIKELQKRTQSWRRYVRAVDTVLGGLPDGQPA
jgi:PadR family transcriptional regulator PadR